MKLLYRPEIDGLRTIAVLSVILYHAQIVVFGDDFFKGGFVGVDIFFVISGYLISRILLGELFEKGKIGFLQFYERRARRILPILFTVFLVSFSLAYKYLLPNQFIEYAQSILSATFFGSNIFFYFTNTQYGAEDSLLQPFLHTWSLGVEEQFYILFPIVLLFAYKFAKNHLVTIIAVLILISLTYADWQSTKNTQLNFFMLTSRLWELGIGSLLAFYELKYGRVKHELLNQTMPLLGLAMIAHAIVFFNNQTPHPSFITLLPTLGTALIILYSVNTTDLVGKVLSIKPIVGVGLISYSMYLWHYPIFAFARIGDADGLHNDEKYLLILLTIVLSIISYFIIEKPFRNKQLLYTTKFLTIISFAFISILLIHVSSYYFSNKINETSYEAFMKERNNYRYSICGVDNRDCLDKKKVLFLGDSMVVDALNIFLHHSKVDYSFDTLGGCPPIVANKIPKNHPTYKECIELNKVRFEKNYENYDLIVIINRYEWFEPTDLTEFFNHLDKQKIASKIILFGDGPSFTKNLTELIFNNTGAKEILLFQEESKDDRILQDIALKRDYYFISIQEELNKIISEEQFKIEGVPLILDQHHLSLNAAKIISKKNRKLLDQLL